MHARPPAVRAVLRALLAIEVAVVVLALAVAATGRLALAAGLAVVPLAILGAAQLGVLRGGGAHR